MELVVKINIEESQLNEALVKRIEQLERELSVFQKMASESDELIRNIMKTQFTKEWFGNRNGMTKDEFIKYISENKI